jgi:hypothetical protein
MGMEISTNKKSNRIPPMGKMLGSIQFSGITWSTVRVNCSEYNWDSEGDGGNYLIVIVLYYPGLPAFLDLYF